MLERMWLYQTENPQRMLYSFYYLHKQVVLLPRLVLIIACALVLLMSSQWSFSAAVIHDIRLWSSPEKTRLVFDLDKPVEHKIFALDNPHRVVIDIPAATMQFDTSNLAFKDTPVRLIRSAKKNKNDLRIVLDLQDKVSTGSFLLKKSGAAGDRLVLDLKYQKTANKFEVYLEIDA